jgi:hypothetical protein
MPEDWWDPNYYEGRFICLMKCGYCQQTVAVAGVSRCEDREVREHKWEAQEVFYPQYFSPAPDLFRIPPNCPEEIVKQVRAAFSLCWCDLSSCLNQLRAVVELLLTELEIKRYSEKDGRRSVIPLHSRIDMLRNRHPHLSSMCDQLTAVKWLGNVGSHAAETEKTTHDAVFDAFDILEHVLHEWFQNTYRLVDKMSQEINKNRGPR